MKKMVFLFVVNQKKLIIGKVFIVMICGIFSLQMYAQTFERLYGGQNSDFGYDIVLTPDSGLVLAGMSVSFATDGYSDAYLIKTNLFGDTLWARAYSNTEEARSIVVLPNGNLVIAGSTFINGNQDILLFSVDSSGDLIWMSSYGGNESDMAYELVEDIDGGFVLTGSYGQSGELHNFIIKTNAVGDSLWGGVYQVGIGRSICLTPDSGYAIWGQANPSFTMAENILMLKFDSNGDTLWTREYLETGMEYGIDIRRIDSGGYEVMSVDWVNAGAGVITSLKKLNESGDVLSSWEYGEMEGQSFLKLTDGYLLIGDSTNGGTNKDLYYIKIDVLGNIQWVRRHGRSAVDIAYSAVELDQNRIALLGESKGMNTTTQFILVVVNSNGCLDVNAQFSSDRDSVLLGETVWFNNETTNQSVTDTIITWFWEFGDGNVSGDMSPFYEFQASGAYSVCLTANNGCEASMVCQPVVVQSDFYWIDSLTILQSLPTPQNSIEVVVHNSSNFSTCGIDSFFVDTSGFEVLIFAFVQHGSVSTPCNSSDTINIGSFAEGDYMVVVELVSNSPPQTFDIDSIGFSIQSTGMENKEHWNMDVEVYPNPVSNWFQLKGLLPGSMLEFVKIWSVEGALIHQISVSNDGFCEIGELPAGIYFLELSTPSEFRFKKIVVN